MLSLFLKMEALVDINKIKELSDVELGYQISLILGYSASSQWCEQICQSLDFCTEVEKLVMEKVGFTAYADKLLQIGRRKLQEQNEAVFDVRKFLISTTARQRAMACYLALQGDK